MTVTGKDDAIDNTPDRSVNVAHAASGGDYGSVSRDLAVTVTDDEGTASLTVGDASVTEGDTGTASLTFTVTLSPAADNAVAVDWATSKETSDTAAPGTDYTAGSGTLRFAAGDTSKTVTVSVTGDQIDESNETLTLTLSNATGGAAIGDATATGTITDDDTRGIVLTPGSVTVTEAGGTGNTKDYKVKLASQPTATVTVAVSSGDTGTATVNKASLSFTTTTWNTDQTVTVTGKDDAIDNTPDRSVNVAHAASGGDYGSVSRNLAVTVTDDEGTASLTVGDASVTEGDSGTASLTFTVTLSPAADNAVAVDWATSKETSDTAAPGTDYTAGSGTLSFAAGDTSKTVTVSVTGDHLDESNETLTLTLSNATGGASIGTAAATGTINDDDAAPSGITLVANPDSVTENGGAKTVTVTASVNGTTRYAAAKTVTVKVGKSADSATEGTDYTTVADLSIAIAAGAASGSKSFTLTPANDALDEPNETISVEGTSAGVTVTADQITITDDDAAPSGITLVANPDTVTENGGAKTVTVTASVNGTTRYAAAKTVAVTVGKSADSATEGTDYTTVADLSIEIAAGAASGSKRFTLTPTNDALDESNETISVEGTLSGVTVTADQITITDDDAAPSGITLVANPDSVSENGGAKTVTVTASVNGTTRYAAAKTVTVKVGKSADSATEGTDYTTVADLSIEIAAGAASGSKRFTLTPTNDALDESNETISVEGTLSGVTVTADQITITDDDAAPSGITLVANPDSVTENGGAKTVTVTASVNGTTRYAAAKTVAVTVGKSADSATEGTDYTTVADLSIEIAAGAASGSKSFTLTPANDALDETNETISVEGASSGVTVTADQITITDDDTRGNRADAGFGDGDRGRRHRQHERLQGEAGEPADRNGDGGGVLGRHRHGDGEQGLAEFHDHHLEHRSDGDGDRKRRRH